MACWSIQNRQAVSPKTWVTGWWVVVLSVILCWGAPWCMAAEEAPAGRTWRSVSELSEEELRVIDLSTQTPRDASLPYLPAEPYPFSPPYTAEEMGFLSTEFSHMPRWNCAFIEAFGSVVPSGYLKVGKTSGLALYPSSPGLVGQLTTKPGQWYTQLLFQDIAPPEAYGQQFLMSLYRTDQQFTTKTDFFVYSPELRRTRRQPQPRRQDKYPGFAGTFDDFLSRDAWEFSWRLMGMDVLYETVRFPNTRPSITLTSSDGSLSEVSRHELKLMGNAYPAYTQEGGVKCYVVEARAREAWIPGYYAPRILYWLDHRTFFPLRIEQYDPSGTIIYIEDRIAGLFQPELGNRGYTSHIFVTWDIPTDLLSSDVHDAHQLRQWSVKDQEVFFNPDFMRRVWFVAPLKSQAEVLRPEEFYLRPHLHRDKFPAERQIQLPPSVEARVRAQEAAGQLVFEERPDGGS